MILRTAIVLLALVSGLDNAHAQLIRQTVYPSGQVCLPGQVCANQATIQTTTQTIPQQVAAVVADHPHVRCLVGNSCGSGTICGANADGAYVVSNAHVWGTQVGKVVIVDCVAGGQRSRVNGRIVMAGYSDSRMVDFAIAFVAGLSSKRYMPMLKTEPAEPPYGTTGAPQCVWPLVVKPFNDARNYGDGLITGSPNAIGGQSGSAIYNSQGHQIALLTWSINGRCAGQKTSKLWQVATSRNVQLADERPEGLIEVGEPCARPEVEVGIFGECAMFAEVQAGHRPPTENVIASVAGSDMENLPIWFVPGTKPPVDPPIDPPGECPEGCMKLTDIEQQIINLIRQRETEALGGRERAIDWMKLIPLILEIIRIIQEGRAGG